MNKLQQDLKYGLVYAKTIKYKRNLEITTNSLVRFFKICKSPYLALSWGKQSIVLAHLIYKLRPNTPMIFLRSWESYLLHNYEDVIKNFIPKIKYYEHFKDNVSWNNWGWQETRDYGSKDIQNMADECFPNWDGVIMGLSKDESVARRITCSSSNTDWKTIFKYKNNKYRCTPIQIWAEQDLAAYIATNNIKLLSTYNNTGLKGRTTARITRNNAEMNGLRELKKENISNYNKIVNRFPELSTYS
jgi:3'-phosphoadenosine 5'-phosphosulfate sulfotransferase (PAPS reductase)/FAD synthetase